MEKMIAFLSGLVSQVVDEKLNLLKKKIVKAYLIQVGLLSVLMFFISLSASYIVFGSNSLTSFSFKIDEGSIVYIALVIMALFTLANFFFLKKTSDDIPKQIDFSDIFESFTDMVTEISETFRNEENLELKRENELLRNEISDLKNSFENFKFDISKTNTSDSDKHPPDGVDS